jgi:sigma-54 dependent transcriptional regulator, acetoin dehydrogenase operon transcriptional activator AcoR
MRVDLHARLCGYELRLPTLAERRVDIGLLVRAFLARMGGDPITLSREAGQALLMHPWPENVRELEQALRHAVALCGGAEARLRDLPSSVSGGSTSCVPPAKKAEADTLSESDKKIKDELVKLLKEHKGNVSGVARAMGKARMQIQRWVRRFEIEAGEYR